MKRLKKSIVLYDVACPLCLKTKKWVSLLDRENRLLWLSLQKLTEYTSLPAEKEAQIREQLHLYDPSRNEHVGYDAITYICKESPLLRFAGKLMEFRAARAVGVPAYRFIANNRYRVGIHDCKDGSCSI